MKSRTIRKFSYHDDIWSVVEKWATESGFTLELQEGSHRIYNKGRWLLLAPTCLDIRQDGDTVTLQTWINAYFYMTLTLFTGKPPEAGIESGGLTAWVQRRKAREAVNRLLVRLGQKPIN